MHKIWKVAVEKSAVTHILIYTLKISYVHGQTN